MLESDWAHNFHEFGVERSPDYETIVIDGKKIVNSSTTTDMEVLLTTMSF
jgi:hypothetical protein